MHGGSGRLRAGILGPTLAAGFYRREVLQALQETPVALILSDILMPEMDGMTLRQERFTSIRKVAGSRSSPRVWSRA